MIAQGASRKLRLSLFRVLVLPPDKNSETFLPSDLRMGQALVQ
jgi:hypothetical protein